MTDGVRNLEKALASISAHWQPHRLTAINDYDVKVVKLQGEFVWHTHPDTDELFLVISGELVIQLRDGDVRLGPGDVFVVPRGVEHCPKAEHEVSAVLLEPQGTVNTGAAGSPLTAELRELAV
jgi:mannose-6-phosphate isomerase-like protein (cupin superfamily)